MLGQGRLEYLLRMIAGENRPVLIDSADGAYTTGDVVAIVPKYGEDATFTALEVDDSDVLTEMNIDSATFGGGDIALFAGEDKTFSKVHLATGKVWGIKREKAD